MQRRGKEAASAFQLFLRTWPFIFLVWPFGELMSSFLSKCSGPGSATDRGSLGWHKPVRRLQVGAVTTASGT